MGNKSQVDRDKIRVKLQRIRTELHHLQSIKARSKDEFLSDPILESAATRMLQVAIEAMIDIGNHIAAREGLGIPAAYRDTVSLLVDNGILDAADRDTFVNMVRFRNRVVHLYDTVEPAEVYRILQEHLSDFDRFIEAIVRRYFSPDAPEEEAPGDPSFG